MPQSKDTRRWIELFQNCLTGVPSADGHQAALLFVNWCVLRETSEGEIYLLRETDVTTMTAASKDHLTEKVGRFARREDVRLPAVSVESNDFEVVPKQIGNPPQDVVDGTALIYHAEIECDS